MRFLPLVWRSLLRKKTRTVFTVLSILVAFVLFGYLGAIRQAFTGGIELTGADRLLTLHRVSLIQLLPVSYRTRIESIPGVKAVSYSTWFGGTYQDPKNFFPQYVTDPEALLELYPEYRLPEDQKRAWLADRMGAIAGRQIATKYGWKIGDKIPIQATIWRKKDGSIDWVFDLVGIYDGAEKGTNTTQFFFRYDYFDESRMFGQGMVGWFIERIAEPARAAEIARRIDDTFQNSAHETKTSTEKAFAQAFANQVGDIGAILRSVLLAVFFTILLVAGNTMAQSVRERVGEIAVLKTLGYSDGKVLGLVMAESLLLSGVGGLLGLGLGWVLIQRGDPTGGQLPIFFLPVRDLVRGVGLVLALGVATGVPPAVMALRLRIVDALRRV
ncbi:MAG: ABC transporter permease [Acidobacteriia bacterium]|nr:ABC transporter permease [Terriglobia bacterium]